MLQISIFVDFTTWKLRNKKAVRQAQNAAWPCESRDKQFAKAPRDLFPSDRKQTEVFIILENVR